MSPSISLTASRRFLDSILDPTQTEATADSQQSAWWQTRVAGVPGTVNAARDHVTNCFTDQEGDIEAVPAQLCIVATGYLELASQLLEAEQRSSHPAYFLTLTDWPTQTRDLDLTNGTKGEAWIRKISNSAPHRRTRWWPSVLARHLPMSQSGRYRVALASDSIDVLAETAYQLEDGEMEDRAGVLESLLTAGLAPMIAAKALGVPDVQMRAAHAALQTVCENSQAVRTWVQTAGLLQSASIDPQGL